MKSVASFYAKIRTMAKQKTTLLTIKSKTVYLRGAGDP